MQILLGPKQSEKQMFARSFPSFLTKNLKPIRYIQNNLFFFLPHNLNHCSWYHLANVIKWFQVLFIRKSNWNAPGRNTSLDYYKIICNWKSCQILFIYLFIFSPLYCNVYLLTIWFIPIRCCWMIIIYNFYKCVHVSRFILFLLCTRYLRIKICFSSAKRNPGQTQVSWTQSVPMWIRLGPAHPSVMERSICKLGSAYQL